MSDARVSREFRDWFGLSNPQGPQHVYGDKGIIVQCKLLSVTPTGVDGEGYEFRFDRWEEGSNGRTPKSTYRAALRFRTGVFPSDANGWVDKVTFNWTGVQVWEYPGAKPEGVAPAIRVSSQ
jgi:hypothetical protein